MGRLPRWLWWATLAALCLSAVRPREWGTWLLEALPVLVGLVLFPFAHRRFALTPMVYGLLALHAVVLLVGAHYTYARVPVFDALADWFGWSRNHYDRLGHFVQGFVPVMLARELLLRTSPLRPGKWLVAVLILGTLGISACYELVEWGVAALTGEASASFLGTQGDPWDTQADMLWAGIGAVTALAALSRLHDQALRRLG